MRKNLIGMIYAYLVCFACIGVLIGFTISGLYGILKIISPKITISSYEREKISSIEKYKDSEMFLNYCKKCEKKIKPEEFSSEEIRIKWEEYKKVVLTAEKHEGTQNIIYMIISMIVCVPLYLVHIKLAKKFGEKEAV